MPKRQSGNKKGKQSNFAKLSIFSIISTDEPKTATIPPFPDGTEFCIASPLILKIFNVLKKSKYPAQDKAEYSPKE